MVDLIFLGIQSAFEILECSPGKIDATRLGTVLRVANLNPSLSTLETLGIGKKEGKIYSVSVWKTLQLFTYETL